MCTNMKVAISVVTFLATCTLFNVVLSCSSSKSSREADTGETVNTGVLSTFGEYIDVSDKFLPPKNEVRKKNVANF